MKHNFNYNFCVIKDGINENDMSQQEELAVLKEQHALLTRLLHQQQEVSLRHTGLLSFILNSC